MASTIVVLQSSDGVVFDVEKRAVLRSLTIAKKLQLRRKSDHNHDSPVVLNGVKGKILEKVVDYCKHHYQPYSTLDDDFDAKFVNVDWTTFFDLIEAAYDLKIKSLMDLTCGTLSKKFKGKNDKEIEALTKNWR
ncbi:hypothetical protein POM88_032940 [Heracleum sosnowskyi]|uniref:SKP1-like protein n=1 Tax=Heracleum sosnowskyi TaxID=360622 RepID=A0AAD8I099_9APIA|nr:hypothetical protein POM88_032940 [Heracleum sosnowskyi]